MSAEKRRELRRLEGTNVHLALSDGHRMDDVTLVSARGLTLWIFVSRAVTTGSESLVTNITVVKKTAAPRILIPLAAVVSVFVDFLVALMLFLVFSLAYGRLPTWRWIALPPLLLVSFLMLLVINAVQAWTRRFQ